jgi:hypothetical protein
MNNKVHAEWISISEVQEILGTGRTKAYELVATGKSRLRASVGQCESTGMPSTRTRSVIDTREVGDRRLKQ